MLQPKLLTIVRTTLYGPHSSAASYTDVMSLVAALDQWRSRVPRAYPPGYPQQTFEHVQAMYLQGVLLAMRPALTQPVVEQDLLFRCAESSAEACEVCR